VSDEEAVSSPEGLEEEEGPRFTDRALEPLSIHLGFVAVAIGVGWLLLEGLVLAERHLLMPPGWLELMEHIPLFPLAMIGGVLTQLVGMKTGFAGLIHRGLMSRIGGMALDLLIVAALGTLSLGALGENLPLLLVLVAGGIAWNLFGFWSLARLLFPRDWVANGLANFGQGMGMTVVGGGLFTAASLPLIYQFGPFPVLVGTGVLISIWFAFGLWNFGSWAREGDDA